MENNFDRSEITFEHCCKLVAQKHNLGDMLVTGHKFSYFKEAAELYKQLNEFKNNKSCR